MYLGKHVIAKEGIEDVPEGSHGEIRGIESTGLVDGVLQEPEYKIWFDVGEDVEKVEVSKEKFREPTEEEDNEGYRLGLEV